MCHIVPDRRMLDGEKSSYRHGGGLNRISETVSILSKLPHSVKEKTKAGKASAQARPARRQ
jgi:hypothetical protein